MLWMPGGEALTHGLNLSQLALFWMLITILQGFIGVKQGGSVHEGIRTVQTLYICKTGCCDSPGRFYRAKWRCSTN